VIRCPNQKEVEAIWIKPGFLFQRLRFPIFESEQTLWCNGTRLEVVYSARGSLVVLF
jgi:hypothetical protein